MSRGSLCSVYQCNSRVNSRGLCSAHYGRWQRHGDPMLGGPPAGTIVLCKIAGCGRKHEARGRCRRHYRQMLRGVPLAELGAADISRFWSFVEVGSEEACWPYTGTRSAEGYGRFFAQYRSLWAHRVAWETANGRPLKEKMVAMHECDNPPCVNPAHLREGTIADNNADKMSKGRHRGPGKAAKRGGGR